MGEFSVRTGTVMGSAHRRKGINNQDCYVVRAVEISGQRYHFGAVLDGCTGRKGSKTEVGSILLANFIASEIPLILAAKTPPAHVPAILYQRCVGYLGSIARSTVAGSPEVLWKFIEDCLFTTVLGFLSTREALITFSAGDGANIVNDEIRVIDEGQSPFYLAYHLIDRSMLPHDIVLPDTFQVETFAAGDVRRFAVSTDGIRAELTRDPGILEEIWNYEAEAPAGLQWWLHRESNLNGRFSDDCTIIAFARQKEGE